MLRQKMLQDMKANKWQFLSILLMAFPRRVYIYRRWRRMGRR